MQRLISSQNTIAVVLLIVLFLSINISSSLLLRNARLDLTENQLFTLSQGTKEILAKIDEPISLTLYYSQSLSGSIPAMGLYAQRVRDMLEEIVNGSDGRISLKIIDPEPFSEVEDVAVARGLVGRPLGSGDLFYFGLIGTNMVDEMQIIPVFPAEREQYLEYDLTRLIDNLNKPRKPVLGVISNLPLDTGVGGLLAAMRGQSQPFLIYSELTDRFIVEFLDPKMTKIPKRVDVLLLAHPRPLNDNQLYAIDQFTMRGGRVIAFIDPHSEVSLTAGPNGRPLQGHTEQSNLPRLMASWGVEMDLSQVLADRNFAQRVATGRDARRQLVDYVLWMGMPSSQFNETDVVMSNIDLLNIGSTGALTQTANATTTLTPLVFSSTNSMLLERDMVAAGPEPDKLLRNFQADGINHVIAARLRGPAYTAFPDGPPSADDASEDASGNERAHLVQTDDANIIIFADSDFFDDRFWVTEQAYLGQRFAVPMADNAKLLLNAVENMMGSDALISLRGRERALRGFDRVEALRKRAEEQYLAEEFALQQRIEEAQGELDRIEKSQALGAEAQAATTQYRTELQSARKALRAVEANLRRDIEALGLKLKWVNIGLMPAFIGIISLYVMVRRRHRRVRTQREGGMRMVGELPQ